MKHRHPQPSLRCLKLSIQFGIREGNTQKEILMRVREGGAGCVLIAGSPCTGICSYAQVLL